MSVILDTPLPENVIAWAYNLHRNATLDEKGVTLTRFQVGENYYSVWIQRHTSKEAQLAAIPPG